MRENLYLSNNLKKIKFIFFFLLTISIIVQLIVINNYDHILSLVYLTLSNIIIYIYCFNENNLKNYPISIFSLIFTNMYSNCSAIFLKSIFLEPIDVNLYDSNFTYLYLFLFNLLLAFLHIIYKNSNFFNKLKVLLQNIFLKLNIDKTDDKNFIFFLGLSSLFLATLSVTFFGKIIYNSNSFGPNIVGDILNGTNIFFICPFIIFYTTKLYNYELTNRDKFYILISFILVIYISLGLNARSAFFDIIFVGILIYFFLLLIGNIEIKILRFNKLFFVFLFMIFLGNTIDKFSNTYLEVRGSRDITNPIENIKNHFSTFRDNKIRNTNIEENTKIFGEDYYSLDILNRMNIIKATDNVLYAKKYLNQIQINNILDYELNQIIALIPNPIIKIFSNNFDKNKYLEFTITSKIYKEVDKFFEGGKSNGISFGILLIYQNIFISIIFILSVLICYSILDSFKIKDKYLIILFVLLYTTSGSLINLISSGSVSDMLGTMIRIIPQGIIFYYLINVIYNKFIKSN